MTPKSDLLKTASRLRIASTLWERLRGIRKGPRLCDGELLMLIPCQSIHSFGLKEPIDVAFIDNCGQVLKSVSALPPNRVVNCRKAKATLERFTNGGSTWLSVGSQLSIDLRHGGDISRLDNI